MASWNRRTSPISTSSSRPSMLAPSPAKPTTSIAASCYHDRTWAPPSSASRSFSDRRSQPNDPECQGEPNRRGEDRGAVDPGCGGGNGLWRDSAGQPGRVGDHSGEGSPEADAQRTDGWNRRGGQALEAGFGN